MIDLIDYKSKFAMIINVSKVETHCANARCYKPDLSIFSHSLFRLYVRKRCKNFQQSHENYEKVSLKLGDAAQRLGAVGYVGVWDLC